MSGVRTKWRIGVVAGLAAASAGCAGAAPSPAAPAASPVVATVVVASPPSPPAPPAEPAGVVPAAAAPMVTTEARAGNSRAERLRDTDGDRELAAAARELQTSAGDCTTACRALGSMERATVHLCALASAPDERASCQDARSQVLSGRDRVRASCGECPGGPSLDKNAPIPSTR
jgi:hypothetical protein